MSFDSSSSFSKKRSRLGEGSKRRKSPFADVGSYMLEKNRKLRDQFDLEASTSSLSGKDGIFSGVSIFVDGFTIPSSQELKSYMLNNGGRFENYFSRQRVTHIICSNLADSKLKNFRTFSRGLPVVKPEWILECVVANKLINWVPYQLSPHGNESSKQQKLSSFFARKSFSSSTDADSVEVLDAKLDAEGPVAIATEQLLTPEENSLSNCRSQDDDDEYVCFGHEQVCKAVNLEAKFTDLEDEHSVVEASDSRLHQPSETHGGSRMDNSSCSTTRSPRAPKQHHSTFGDPNFFENYFKNSRLHFIGTWRNRYRKRFCNKLSGVDNNKVNVNSISTSQKAFIIHIDMDSFFVSVVIRNYPELINKPVAVCHSDNPKGTAEISSANYPAREYGVKAGMFVRDAKALCPHLVIVPYDFEAYGEVADQFYSILHKHCSKVQAVSCDEAFLDVTESANNDPVNLTSIIRREIAETTKCPASAGIAENMLLARLATRSAKPNGQCFIATEEVESYLKDLPIKALPGIGHSLGEKLKSRQIHTCGQLRLISKETLHKDFGAKTGEMLWNYCRGVDHRAVEVVQETKSVGAEVNWGVRFNDIVECEQFLENLCKEVSFRLQECGVEGRTITLKVKKRKKGADEPAKFMGHGDCESMCRSMTLQLPTDDMILLERVAKQIFASFHIGCEKKSIESWLASYGKTKEHGKNTTCAPNLGNYGDTLFLEKKPDCRTQQDDANCQSCRADENFSSAPSHIKLSSAVSHDNRASMLPELCHLDIEVIKNLPPEIYSEMNDMYNGKLCNFMKKYIGEESKTNSKPADTPYREKETASSSGLHKIGSDSDGNLSGGQTACLEPCADTGNKGKRPPCSRDVSTFDIPFQSEGARSDFGNAPTDMLEILPGGGRAQTVDDSKIDLWLGNPPKWVELFKLSTSLFLNVFSDLCAKLGGNCNLSCVMQSMFTYCPPNFDLTGGGRDEALSCLCELIMQYIDLKIESDIEELYLCFRFLKRFASTSTLLLEVYNIVLPLLQVSVNEQYGGQMQLSFEEQQ